MSPDAAGRVYGLLNGMLESCKEMQRALPDTRDQQRLRIEAIAAIVTEALGVVLRDHPRAQVGNLCCSFCGKRQAEVTKLIAGPCAYICDECIRLCDEVIAQEQQAAAAEPGDDGPAMAPTDAPDSDELSAVRRSVVPPQREP